jgi:GGDEF domain-containing protein
MRAERHINVMFVQNLHTDWAHGEAHGQDLRFLTNLRHADVLMTFCNSYRFQEYLTRELSRAERFGSPLTVVRCYLDKGTSPKLRTRISQAFDQACVSTLRGYDYASRLSSNEFALLLPEADRFGAEVVVQRITETVEKMLFPCASWALRVGIACFPFDGESVAALLTASTANEILYGGYARQAEFGVQA